MEEKAAGPERRLKTFKKTIEAEEGRRRREETTLNIRKNKKDEHLAKRRFAGGVQQENNKTGVNAGQPKEKQYTIEELPALVKILQNNNGDETSLYEAARGIRRMLAADQRPPVREVIQAGAIPPFVQLLTRTDAYQLQFEAAWALTNIASTDFTSKVADEPNALQYLINLLCSPVTEVRDQCSWCIGNIAGDGPHYRDQVLKLGALGALLLNVQQPANDTILSNVVWTISNLCRGKPHPQLDLVKPAIPALCHVLATSTNEDIIADALWAFSYLSDGSDDRIDAILQGNERLVSHLVKLVHEGKPKLIAPSLRTLGNFVSGTEAHTQAVLDARILNISMKALQGGKRQLRKEMCWLLSNIAAGTHSQIDQLFQAHEVIEALIKLSIDAEWETRKEAIWAVSNIFTGGNETQVNALVELNGIGAIATTLEMHSETKMLLVAMEALENVFMVGERLDKDYVSVFDEHGGIDTLEALQTHQDDKVYNKAAELIDRFIGQEEVEDENVAPVVEGDTFTFGIMSPPPAKNLFEESTPSPGQFSFGGSNQYNFAAI